MPPRRRYPSPWRVQEGAESYVVVFQQTEKLPLQAIIAGTYFDRFTKIDGTWRLTERIEDMELIGNLSEHLLRDIS